MVQSSALLVSIPLMWTNQMSKYYLTSCILWIQILMMNNLKMHKIHNKHFEINYIYFHKSSIDVFNILFLLSHCDKKYRQPDDVCLVGFHFGRVTKDKYLKMYSLQCYLFIQSTDFQCEIYLLKMKPQMHSDKF